MLCRYSRLGCTSRLRFMQYLPYFKLQGLDVSVLPLLGDDYLTGLFSRNRRSFGPVLRAYFARLKDLKSIRGYDLLWIEKELFPWLPAWVEQLLVLGKIPYVVDYDDAIFHRYDLHGNPLVRVSLGKKIDMIMRRAALVIAGNEYLAERARRSGAQRVEVIPTVIDLERYYLNGNCQAQVFTIGWIGSPKTAKYLALLQPALAAVCTGEQAKLLLVGSGPLHLNGVNIEIRRWSEETEVADILNFDVGIMPLMDEPFEQGKCGYKLIQYMACSKPVVASPVGVNRMIVEHGVNGYLAESQADWVNALNLLRVQERRTRMGLWGRKKVEEHYCLQVTAPHLVRMLQEAGRLARRAS